MVVSTTALDVQTVLPSVPPATVVSVSPVPKARMTAVPHRSLARILIVWNALPNFQTVRTVTQWVVFLVPWAITRAALMVVSTTVSYAIIALMSA